MMAMNSVFSRRLWSKKVEGFDLRRSQGGDEEAHVLAVDDSLVDRKVIESLLKFYSCKVTAVDSGRRALQFLGLDEEVEDKNPVVEGLKVDLIITDYCMPGMTGYELLKKIKESAAFKEIPVVIMSSENVLARIDRCLEEGAEDFIVKPVKLSDLERLKEHLMGRDNDSNYRGGAQGNKRKQPDGPDLSDSTCTSETPPSSESSPSSQSLASSPSPSPPPSSRSSPEPPRPSSDPLDSPSRRLKSSSSCDRTVPDTQL
ncbi:hypothetical protein V2J09_013038 [Rumex salicifolius]